MPEPNEILSQNEDTDGEELTDDQILDPAVRTINRDG